MNEDNISSIDGVGLIDATQNAVIEAVDNVSGIIAETTTEAPVSEHHHEIFYKTAEFWVGFAFILVVVALVKPIGGLLKSMLSKRRDDIADKINQAEKLHDDAQKLLAEYERKFVHVNDEVALVLEKSENQIEHTRQEERRKLNNELNLKSREADGIIASAQMQTLSEINTKTAEKAVQTARRFLAANLTDQERARMIDESIERICDKIS